MSSNDLVQLVSKSVKQKRARIAGWILPAGVVAFLGAFFSIYFFPLGIILFMIAIIIVAFNVLRTEATDNLDVDT